MKFTNKHKFIFSYICITALFLLLLNTYGHAIIYNKLIHQEQKKLYDEAELIVQDYVPDIGILDISDSTLRKHFSSLQLLTNMRVWLVNSSGKILMDSNVKKTCEDKNINQYDSSFLSKQIEVGENPKGMVEEKTISVIYPITESLDTSGYVVLMTPVKGLQDKATSYIDAILICYFIILFVMGFVFMYLYYETVRPLKKMTKAAKEYADGHFDYEMGRIIGRDYMDLASAIKFLAERMDNLTEYQKNFVANVSHDFRSPLTSIKGYTEAMADGTIPPEMQEKYFKIILFEVSRLDKLTQSLLELSQFEHNGMVLEISDVDINKIIKDNIATFEQRCMAKKITFELTFEQEKLYVKADGNKIQQVIQNLLDNAIKFSANDSQIEIHTTKRNQKVFVSVKDHGIGIPKDCIHKVWSRFYKTDISRGKDKTGTGLGLSITKEIIDAHGENINVISTEGVGTEFIFSLQESDVRSYS